MRHILMILALMLLMTGCVTDGTVMTTTTYSTYPYWTGNTYVTVDPSDYYYRVNGLVYHHHHSRNIDIVVREVPRDRFVIPHRWHPAERPRYSPPPRHEHYFNQPPLPPQHLYRPPDSRRPPAINHDRHNNWQKPPSHHPDGQKPIQMFPRPSRPNHSISQPSVAPPRQRLERPANPQIRSVPNHFDRQNRPPASQGRPSGRPVHGNHRQ